MILVTGGTGILGSHLLFHLLQENDEVIALYRTEYKKKNVLEIFSYYSNIPEKLFKKIIWRKADITNIAELEDAFENVTEIYHCAAYVGFKNKNFDKYYKNNAVGTANIVNLSLELGIKKLVHVSSIAAIGLNTEGITTEENHLNPDDVSSFYSKTKYYAELEVWRGVEEGLNAVIVNPSVILAPYFLNKKAKKILNFVFKKGVKYYTCGKKGYVDVNDVAKIMIELMRSEISSERFILNSKNLSFRILLKIFTNKIKKSPPSVKLYLPKLKLIKFILNIVTFGKSPVNNQLIYYAINDELYSNEKIRTALGVKFMSITESVGNIVKIYKKTI